MLVILGQLLGDCKTTPPINLTLILGHLPIPVIGKRLLGTARDALSTEELHDSVIYIFLLITLITFIFIYSRIDGLQFI